MAKFIKSDYEHASSSLSNIDTIKTNITSVRNKLSIFAANLALKLEGELIDAVIDTLDKYDSDLEIYNNNLDSVMSLVDQNSSVISAFGDDEDLDSIYIDELKTRINKLNSYIEYAKRIIGSLNYEDFALEISYWNGCISGYQSQIDEIEPLYKRLHEEYLAVKEADACDVEVNI